jgi:outer membrane protein TolC
MERRTALQERGGAEAGRSRLRRILFAAVAAGLIALPMARAEAQQPPEPPSLPAGGERSLPSDGLPRIARVPGGWTADSVGARARKTSFDVAAMQASLRAAEAHVTAAVVAFFPRLSGLGTYTRYQDLTQPSLGTLVEAATAVSPGPISSTTPLAAVPLSFVIPLDYWVAQATLTVPLTDYVLRLSQEHGAASRRADAAQLNTLASQAQAYSDAKIAFYQYVKAVAQRDVLVQAKAVAQVHLQDAQNLFRVGRGSNADVQAAAADVAAAQLRAAEEAYRSRRELFLFSKGTSVELADSEAALFRARLASVSARIDQRIARVRVEHATGRDVTRRTS